MTDFEVFTRTRAAPAREPTLTVTLRGTLNLNEAAFNLLGEPKAVQLLYSQTDRIIGLRPAARDEPDTYLLQPRGALGHTRMVSAKAFCRWIGAGEGGTRRYPLTLADGVGCADLSQPGIAVTSNRAQR